MGKLLRKLGLEEPLPQDLANAATAIGDVEGTLDKARVKQLKLKESARDVAENLNDLDGHVEPALLAGKKRELESLARRIAGRAPNDAGLTTDAMELQMLRAETEVALKDNKSTRAALTQARTNYGAALVARVDTGGNLATDLKAYIDGQVANENTTRVTAALKALDELRNSTDPRVSQASKEVTAALAKQSLAQGKAAGPSMADREASRTPNDVLVHLMTVVNNTLEAHPKDADLKAVAASGRKLFMSHTLNTEKVADLIDEASDAFAGVMEPGMVDLCRKLKGQLPENDEALAPAQLQDNLYGRVFDTKMISALVKTPPPELLAASGKSGAAFAATLTDNADNERAAKYLVDHYIIEDKRPWSAAVPAFATLAQAADGKAALAAVKAFLNTPPTTGQEIIAFSYMMAKMPIAQKEAGTEPAWLTNASFNYNNIIPQANRERGAADKVISTAAGITMLHQPDASDDDNLVPSERPGTANRMGKRNALQPDQDLPDDKRSVQNKIQQQQALPFASGVSGTTNVLLHLHAELEGIAPTGVTPQEFLMNAMMFLVYDGGHSMHEAMWTANQIEAQLKTQTFGLNDASKPNEPKQFVSDYDRLTSTFTGTLKTAIEGAQETAWQGTQEYLEKNSVFAQ